MEAVLSLKRPKVDKGNCDRVSQALSLLSNVSYSLDSGLMARQRTITLLSKETKLAKLGYSKLCFVVFVCCLVVVFFFFFWPVL